MPAFAYQAVDAAGRSKKGIIEATTLPNARRALREQSLLPVSVAPASRGAAAGETSGEHLLDRVRRRGVSSRALSTATRQLATLIASAVRIDEALRLVAAQTDVPVLAAILLDVRGAVVEGSSFAAALARHPRVFPDFYVASISAGERSGRMPEVVGYLAEFVESRSRATQKLRLALLYPALLASVSMLMMTMMMIFVVPDIVRVFVSRGADLPLLTRLLIGVSEILSRFGLVLLALLIAAGFVVRRELARPERRLAFDRALAMRRPTARFVRQASAARFAATLATLVQSAVPLLDALTVAAAAIPNRYIRSQAETVAARVREGASVSRTMAETPVFPSMLVAIVASGETGGKLGPVLGRAAAELDRETEAQVAVIVSLVEPVVLLLMGGLVLLMVMAILMPIIGLNDLAVG